MNRFHRCQVPELIWHNERANSDDQWTIEGTLFEDNEFRHLSVHCLHVVGAQ
jgi:hypothetical protein